MGRNIISRLIAVAAGAVAVVAGLALADRLLPPDLSRYRDLSTTIVDSDGRLLRAFTSTDGFWRLPATPDAVEPAYLNLLIAYEDRRFWRHPGFDPLALARAAAQWATRGRIVSGGSTITMQVVRLLEPRPRTVAAKLSEIARAAQLEWRYSKRDILSMYLTLAPFGGNIEGIRAASLILLGKTPDRLTVAEAALLVSIPQSPAMRQPDRHPASAAEGRRKVLSRARDNGLLSAVQADEALDEGIPVARHALPFTAPHLAQRLAARAPRGAVIATTLDSRLQATVEALVRGEGQALRDGARLAAMIVDNHSRNVLAYIGSDDFFGTNGQIDLPRAVRSPGSTLKPFVYGLAMDDLLVHPDMRIDDLPGHTGTYRPRNFDGAFHGRLTIREALQQSLNIPAIVVAQRLGPERFTAALRRAGARLQLPGSGAADLPVVLGGVGMTLADLAQLYAALADGGTAKPLRYRRDSPSTPGTPFLSAATSHSLTAILADAPRPHGVVAASGSNRRIAYKTGTSYGFRDAWAAGYSPRHTIVVWIGRADGTPRPGIYGRDAAAPLLFRLFDLLPAHDLEFNSPATESRSVPINLRHFEISSGPRIQFPEDGSLVALQTDTDGAFRPLPLRAEGGSLPFSWMVNGLPVTADDLRDTAYWQPDGEGFTRIVVIDGDNRSAIATVRLK